MEKNAEDPIQDIKNRSESDEEDREPPVHTSTSQKETERVEQKLKKQLPQRMLKIRFKILRIAQKVMRKISNLPSVPVLLLKERERVARPVIHPPRLKHIRKSKQTRPNQPNQKQALTNGVISSFDSKRSLDTVMFLNVMQAIHHWETGVAT